MNKLSISLATIISLYSALSMADVDISAGYQTPEEALSYGRTLQQVKTMLTENNYAQQSCEINAINYFTEPSADIYKSHVVECNYLIPSAQWGIQTDYAKVVMDIYYHKSILLYHVSDVDVNYFTVY